MKRFILLFLMITPAFSSASGEKVQPSSAAQDCRVRYDVGQYSGAVGVCEHAARAGDVEAQYRLGRMYEKGDGVEKNLETALRWYKRAGGKGHAASQRRVAAAYAFGLGGAKKDEVEAAKWLKRAAESGDARAQKQLAEAYRRGLGGFPKDENLAREWSERAQRSSND